MQQSQFWKLYKQDPPCCATVMKTSIGLVYLLACLLEPFMPSFSKEVCPWFNEQWCNYLYVGIFSISIWSIINILFRSSNSSIYVQKSIYHFVMKKEINTKQKRLWDLIPWGHRIVKPAPLFKGLVILLHSFGHSLFVPVPSFHWHRTLYAGWQHSERHQDKNCKQSSWKKIQVAAQLEDNTI